MNWLDISLSVGVGLMLHANSSRKKKEVALGSACLRKPSGLGFMNA